MSQSRRESSRNSDPKSRRRRQVVARALPIGVWKARVCYTAPKNGSRASFDPSGR
ncbi:MAG TPA: hypothetical protein VHD32_09205 [Candidatus Didemnitutus sp.]|nr:hypothetical protein [Candidatus Didemnitutus sp.]